MTEDVYPREYKWLDIASAPKDGTQVLYFSPGNKHAGNRNARDPHMKVDWFSDRWPRGYHQLPEAPYTHWHPLPPAPVAESGLGRAVKAARMAATGMEEPPTPKISFA